MFNIDLLTYITVLATSINCFLCLFKGECFDRVNVEYSKKDIKFNVEGWPDDVPFRQPSRLGGNQLRKIWERRDEISFSHNITTAIAQ